MAYIHPESLTQKTPRMATVPVPTNKDLNSNNQIVYLTDEYANRVNQLIYNYTKVRLDIRTVKGGNDAEKYQTMFEMLKGKTHDVNEYYRGDRRANEIRKLFPSLFYSVANVLDIGSNTGSISYGILVKLPKGSKMTCMDIVTPIEYEPNWCTYINKSATLSTATTARKYDVIIILMTLHHIYDWKKVIANAYKWLKPGGKLVIRDHDCNDIDRHIFLDVIDRLYLHVLHPCQEIPTGTPHYYSYFLPRSAVLDELRKNKFTIVEQTPIEQQYNFTYSVLCQK